jgi:hypothetical protein
MTKWNKILKVEKPGKVFVTEEEMVIIDDGFKDLLELLYSRPSINTVAGTMYDLLSALRDKFVVRK